MFLAWCQCKVIDVIEDASKLHHFRVQFIDSKVNNLRVVSPKQIAYGHPPTSRLPVGERVIALFNTTTHGSVTTIPGTVGLPRQFYPGIIAEPLQPYNMFRYLIFFDDGYAQYVTPQDVRLVHDVSKAVWEDVHPHSKEFIENYLQNYKKERPMVRVRALSRLKRNLTTSFSRCKLTKINASSPSSRANGSQQRFWRSMLVSFVSISKTQRKLNGFIVARPVSRHFSSKKRCT